MSTQQFQYPKSYYQLEPYQYQQQQHMNGSGQSQALNQTQQPAGGQTQGQPLSQLQMLSQYQQHPYGGYYNPNQLPMQQMQQPQHQQQQYQQYQQQSHQQGSQAASDYSSHYPGYSNSSAAHYNQYPVYQGQQHVPQGQVYGAPASQASAQQAPSASTSSTAPSMQSTQPGQPGAVSSTTTGAPTPGKGSVSSDSLGGNANSSVGQYQPPGIRPRVTTTMWEDEKTLCYQVDANNVSVVRRADNNMINGTKLLNVAQMTRGRRDSILKLEKVRHVVKIGSMHLKGVWIPFERALAMAQREGIVDLLYPLFVRDIKRVIQTGVTPASQGNTNSGTTSNAKNTPLVANSSSTYPSTGASGAAASSNPNVAYYPQYPSQYAPAAGATSGSGLADTSSSVAPQQQGQQVGQYPFTTQPFYNQYYGGYNQGSGSGDASSSGYSYSQPGMYSSYGYGQIPGQQHQQVHQQSHQLQAQQLAQPLGQQGSPGDDKKDLKNEVKK